MALSRASMAGACLALLLSGCIQSPGPGGPPSASPFEEGPIPETPLSHPGGRWPTSTITVAVGPGPRGGPEAVREALRAWENATGGLLRFEEVPFTAGPQPEARTAGQTTAEGGRKSTLDGADITVHFVERLSRTSTEELGDAQLQFVKVGNRTLFQKGVIELLVRTPSGNPLTPADALSLAIHEVGHTLGLGHSASPGGVMAPRLPVPSTKARFPREQDAAPLKALYAEPARADLAVEIRDASRKTIGAGTYLDIEFRVKSEGLLPASGTWRILAGGEEVRSEPLQELAPGRSLTLTLSNLKAPAGFTEVAVVVEPAGGVAEYDAENNRAEAMLG